MEKEQIKIYLERMHKYYAESADQYTKDYNQFKDYKGSALTEFYYYNQFKDYKGSALTEFYLKKTTEYTNKADAVYGVIKFITEAELNNY
jgi:hypothetical protein